MNSFTQASMYRLLVFVSFVTVSIAGVVRVPKIYNALISSDENLSPSHAIPVVEPVLRTTALGVAFPPIYVHPPHNVLLQTTSETNQKGTNSEPRRNETETIEDMRGDKNPSIPQLTYHGSLYPLAIDSYFPYSYSSELLFPALPYYQQPIFGGLAHVNEDNTEKKVEIPYATNIKKNPEIPDVPPPPLPGKEKPRH